MHEGPSEPPVEIMSFGVSPVNYSDSDPSNTPVFKNIVLEQRHTSLSQMGVTRKQKPSLFRGSWRHLRVYTLKFLLLNNKQINNRFYLRFQTVASATCVCNFFPPTCHIHTPEMAEK